MTKILLSSLIILITVGIGGYKLYHHGYKNGAQSKESEWRQRESKLLIQINELEVKHAKQQKDIADEVEYARKNHAADVASQRIVYEQRLSQSDRRSKVYRTQAEACDTSSRDLADHAAKLDRSLEEGRGVVRELWSALRFCEDRVSILGDVIKNDRKLSTEITQ
jgi:hypothetical protein